MKPPVPTERQTQRAILQMLGYCFPRALVWHVPNGAYLGDNETARKRTMGMLLGDGLKPGVCDLTVVWNHGIAFIEVKRPGCRNRLSPEQEKFHAQLTEMGFEPAVVTSPEEVFDYLKSRGAPSSVQSFRRAA